MSTTAVFAEDDRKPIERLRRSQLWKIADAHGLSYPPGATKDTMIQLLEGNGVDVTQPLPEAPVEWETQYVTNEAGNKVPQLHPVQPKRQGGATTADVHRIVEEQEKAQEEDDDEKEELRAHIRQLEERQARMMDRMEQMMDRLNAQPVHEPAPEPAPESATEAAQEPEPDPQPDTQPETETAQQEAPAPDSEPDTEYETGLAKIARLRRQCKEAGLPVVRTDRVADLEAKLREASRAGRQAISDGVPGSGEDDGRAEGLIDAMSKSPESGTFAAEDDEWEV